MERVGLYMRVSTTDQNIDLQRDALKTLCERHPNWQITEYIDHGISGAKSSRPALDRLMGDCRRMVIDRVCVYKFDRFARSVSHLLRALEEFESLGVEFTSLSEAIDTSTSMGKLVFTIVSAVAELERSLIVDRVRAGQKAARARGKHIGRPSPLTPIVTARIASMRSEGASIRAIASQLGLAVGTVHRVITSSDSAA